MNDKPIIIAGLVVVLAVLTSPIWYSLAAGEQEGKPEFDLQGDCVEDVDYMLGHHMDLLEEWRNDVVREGNGEKHKSSSGEYEKSLTKTCLAKCHVTETAGQAGFCRKCHEYADVHPTCWDCHVENPKPKGE